MLSAALIARNEERFLAGCLESVRDLVDEIVLVDTGSQDGTKQIAARYGARIFDFPWIGDFAAARNKALEHSTGQWILYIDADERLRPNSRQRLHRLLADPAYVGYFVQFHSSPGLTPYWEMRLFRNHPRIRFEGVIHENIWPGIRRYQMWNGGDIAYSDVVFDHLGYEGDQQHKHERNLPLLLEAVERNPKRIFYWCHLAQVYEGLGRREESRASWEEAVRRVRKKRKSDPQDGFAFLGLIQSVIEAKEDAADLLREARKRFPENVQLDWYEARFLMSRERWEAAIPFLERLLRRGETRDFPLVAGYDDRLFGELSLASLATCYFRLGSYREARRCYQEAAKHDPESREYQVKEALCEKLADSSG